MYSSFTFDSSSSNTGFFTFNKPAKPIDVIYTDTPVGKKAEQLNISTDVIIKLNYQDGYIRDMLESLNLLEYYYNIPKDCSNIIKSYLYDLNEYSHIKIDVLHERKIQFRIKNSTCTHDLYYLNIDKMIKAGFLTKL